MEKQPDIIEEAKVFARMKRSSIYFVKVVYQLIPQPVLPEFRDQVELLIGTDWEGWEVAKRGIKREWFAPFEKGKHITWQQWLVLLSVDKAMAKQASNKISVSSGHGIGKSGVVSWIILWFLYCHYNCQVPCTAPTAYQMYDVLWKELALWIERMPENVKQKYEWGRDHLRMAESPETWFARAQTSSKENTEALAGVHADDVLVVADEASGVPEQVYNTAEGSWTSGNILVILISNPTRINGYFYDTHHKLKQFWQTLSFSSIDSPIVDDGYAATIEERHGKDSAEYGIRVLGKFPKEDSMDDSGYVSLLIDKQVSEQMDIGKAMYFAPNSILGVDPAGEGDDKTSWVIRDNFKAKKIHEETKSTAKSIAEKTLTFINQYKLEPRNVVIDNFGSGADVGMEIAIASKGMVSVTTVNMGELSERLTDQDLYLNKRAEGFYKGKKWLMAGGEIVENANFKEELLSIKYKRNLKGKIQIMPKVDMKKKYGTKSPNDADAFSLTFMRDIAEQDDEEAQRLLAEMDSFDRFAPI